MITNSPDREPGDLQLAKLLGQSVGAIGGAFMLHPDTLTPGKQAGYPGGFSYYVVGRGGVLGDVDASVVISSFAFFAPALVRSLWDAGIGVEGARAGADRYALACADWGRSRLGAFAQAERLVELVTAVVDGAELAGLSLFAGWQSQTRVNDPQGRCYQLLNVLRELRGSVHITAVVAHGVTPLQALLANPINNGSETAERFGWSGPFENVDHLRDDFIAVENLTNVLMAQHLSVLTTVEQNELLGLVTEVHSILFS